MATDLESFRDTVAHRRPARVLYYGGFTPDLRRRVIEHIGTEDIAAHYGFWKMRGISIRRPADLPPLDYSRYWEGVDLPEGTRIDDKGCARVPSGVYHFFGYRHPLKNASSLREIEEYPLDDPTDWDHSHMPDEVAAAHADGAVAILHVGHMYETAWQIRGYEEFLIDTIERPAWAECLLERLYRANRARALAGARAGADLVFCGDDVANQNAPMFAPETWRRLIHSRWAEIWRAVKEAAPGVRTKYHSDGNVMPLLDDLVDAGLDILNPVQPECMDLDAIRRRFGTRLTFDGCIGTQSTMPWGTPDEVRDRTREVIDKYGRDGGLIVAPTHVLEPEVPLANIDALFETCRDYGRFE